MEHDANYYSDKWTKVIKALPNGGDYHFELRKYGYQLAIDSIPENSKVFDYACGLGIIDQMLVEQKNCIVAGCDFSPVAVDFCKEKTGGDFRVTDKIWGEYDVIIAAYFLEHIPEAWNWVSHALEHAPRVICHLPRNFSHHGEHIDMCWDNWADFKKKFEQFDFIRLDTFDKNNIDTMSDLEIKYPKIGQFAHPIIEFRNKGGFMNPSLRAEKIEVKHEEKKTQKEIIVKKKKVSKKVNPEEIIEAIDDNNSISAE